MTEATNLMLCTVFACVSGFSEDDLKRYSKVFQIILDNDRELDNKNWNIKTHYELKTKYFGKQNLK